MEQNSGLRLILSKRGNLVTIQFPVINFQTGPVSPEDPYYPNFFLVVISILLMVSYRKNSPE